MKCWNKTTDSEFYNPYIKTKINIIDYTNGYKVKITNLGTKSSSWTYKTGRTKKQAIKSAKEFMKIENRCKK